MPRPKIPRMIRHQPNVYFFKPRGIPLRKLDIVTLFNDELEALKLYELERLDQISAAEKMEISQPTFARLLDSAHKKLSEAVVFGKAIEISDNKMKK